MSIFGRATFEVRIYQGGRWAINQVMPTEEAARHRAAELLRQKTTDGVRIIKESSFASGARESEIFCEMKEVREKDDFTVTPIKDAPLCDKVSDYYQTAARNTMARMFTKYLEKHEMTPLEFLHSHKNLKRALNLDAMVPSAVDKIASLHARATGGDARKCKDIIFKAVDDIAARAREVDAKKLPELKGSALDDLFKKIDAKYQGDEERQFMATVAFVRTSVNWVGWLGKMSEILPMAQSQQDERARLIVDEMLADILVAKTIVKDVIGISKHLGDALMRMLDLLEGKCKPTEFAAEELVELLNHLFANDTLPKSRAVLVERIGRDLAGPIRLTNSEEKSDDKHFFDQILERVVTDHGVVGGSAVSFGLTERWARLNNMGGPLARNEAMGSVRDKLPSGVLKFAYLLDMYGPGLPSDLRPTVEAQVRDLAAQLNSVNKIAPHARTEKGRLQEAAAIQRLVLDSHLQSNTKDSLANKFDDIVSNYIIAHGVIERLDDKGMHFRDRATRLVTFCASGVLTVGRATTIARDSVVAYLRRKDFIAALTDDIPDPADKEKAIKDFYVLLSKTGFDVS
jgi:hypothetical protein